MYKKLSILLILLVISKISFSQKTIFPENYIFSHLIAIKDSSLINQHSIHPSLSEETATYKPSKYNGNWFKRKIIYEDFLFVDSSEYTIVANPILNFEYNKKREGNTQINTINSRGATISGRIGQKLFFGTLYVENQGTFTDSISSYINHNIVVPGQGVAKTFKTRGFDYAYSSGYVEYKASKWFDITLGHGKQFIGEGYRSLILSDNAFNYPYLIEKINYKDFEYGMMNTIFSYPMPSGAYPYESGYNKTFSTLHYLSYSKKEKYGVSLYDLTIWQNENHDNNITHIAHNYFNPLPLWGVFRYGLNNANNSIVALSGYLVFMRNNKLYSQVVADDMSSDFYKKKSNINNKFGYQIGVSLLNIPFLKNTFFVAEYNRIRPYTYASNTAYQSISHYNQPLAHPSGANISEITSIIGYRYKRVYSYAKANYINTAIDSKEHYSGSNPLIPLTISNTVSRENYLGQGQSINKLYADFNVGFIINPATKMAFEVGVSNQLTETESNKNNEYFVHISLSTKLFNHYYDF